MDIQSWPDVRDALDAHEGVLLIKYSILRDLAGVKRVDFAKDKIRDRLAEYGIGHIPEELPRQAMGGEEIMIYWKGSEAGETIRAITTGAATEDAVRALRRLNSKEIPIEVLDNVMEEMTKAFQVANDRAQEARGVVYAVKDGGRGKLRQWMAQLGTGKPPRQ